MTDFIKRIRIRSKGFFQRRSDTGEVGYHEQYISHACAMWSLLQASNANDPNLRVWSVGVYQDRCLSRMRTALLSRMLSCDKFTHGTRDQPGNTMLAASSIYCSRVGP